MLNTIKQLFESLQPVPETASDHRQQLAVAVLLLEVANADQSLEEQELAELLDILRRYWGLSGSEADVLLNEAIQESDLNTSMHNHIRVLNSTLEIAQRERLLKDLWRVANADKQIHHWEEHLIRRLADMLGVGHRVFIQARHQALDMNGH